MSEKSKYKTRRLDHPLANAGYSNQFRNLKKDNERLTRGINGIIVKLFVVSLIKQE